MASLSTGAPVVSVSQVSASNRASPSTFLLEKRRASSFWSRASTLIEKHFANWIGVCALALRLTQTITIGGLSVSEHTAVAVSPVRLPSSPTAMIVTAPA